jgi:hypothetical protein
MEFFTDKLEVSSFCEWRGLRLRHSQKEGECADFAGTKPLQNQRLE